jgi:hypothetical protein
MMIDCAAVHVESNDTKVVRGWLGSLVEMESFEVEISKKRVEVTRELTERMRLMVSAAQEVISMRFYK